MVNQVEEMIMDMSLWAVILSRCDPGADHGRTDFSQIGSGPAGWIWPGGGDVCVRAGLWSCPRQFLPVLSMRFYWD